ncbi:MAG: DUF2782 domain-containing protein [Magnetococcales bacterium]|nr:DUF2782 domain-containing protein [Magnetococcales bacterium]
MGLRITLADPGRHPLSPSRSPAGGSGGRTGNRTKGGSLALAALLLLPLAAIAAPGKETTAGKPGEETAAGRTGEETAGGDADTPVIGPDGEPVAKGVLVSVVSEDLDPDTPGPETVVRLYEDSAGNRVREFVMRGFLFQLEVAPDDGPAYYLVDNDGDGRFETRLVDPEPRLVIPQWVFHRF